MNIKLTDYSAGEKTDAKMAELEKNQPDSITPPGDETIYRRAWTMVDIILKPEKCDKHQEWMKPYTTFDQDYNHQTLERVCESCISENKKFGESK